MPVATLAGSLLADYPLRDWDEQPPLPFQEYKADGPETWGIPRLLRDVEFVLDLIGERYEQEMDEFYPKVDGKRPWGYLWAVTLPCQNCGRTFPLTGSLLLRRPLPNKNDPGQSYRIVTDSRAGTFRTEVHDGPPTDQPTLVTVVGRRGKAAVCPFCEHVHVKDVHARLMNDGLAGDELLVVADIDDSAGKRFREPAPEELNALATASKTLRDELPFTFGMPAVPDEKVPAGNNDTVRPSMYGYRSYGAFCNDRQTLGFVKLARIICDLSSEMNGAGLSSDFVGAITGYAGSGFIRKLRRSTRGARLEVMSTGGNKVGDLFTNEASIAFSYDYFEAGCGYGPGTWRSVAPDTVASLRTQLARPIGRSAIIRRGSAAHLPMRDSTFDAVVTDPPYNSMIDYSDASDLFFVWLKRALVISQPDFGITSHPLGVQEKEEEAIVKRGGTSVSDHRTEAHYERCITDGFAQARQKVKDDGVVTIVFGHGDPDVWHRLLTSIDQAGLILTGSWPARTESGGKAGSANIETTLTLACRPAPPGRPPGRVAEVDAEVQTEIKARMPLWDAAGLALTDELMASAGPAMEVVGRYSEVRDKVGKPVALDRYLPLARQMVQEAADIRLGLDYLPLGTFDERSQFALFWAKAFGRSINPASEARWQRLAADLDNAATAGITVKDGKGVRLAYATESALSPEEIAPTTSVFDVALAMVASGKSLARAAEVLIAADRVEDPYVWAAVHALSGSVPEADPDGEAWTYLVRNRQAVVTSTRNLAAAQQREADTADAASAQQKLFGDM